MTSTKTLKKISRIISVAIIFAILAAACNKAGTGNISGKTSHNGYTEGSSITPSGDESSASAETTHENGSAIDITTGVGQESDIIMKQIKEMTLEEKIGQMFIVGFKGYVLNDSIRSMISDYHFGGVILFGNNVKNASQLIQLVNSLKQTNPEKSPPLFISVDEEGGRISRMPSELHKFPSNAEIGKMNDSDFSYSIGKVIAEEIRAFGFNMDFAPVLDIYSNPKNTVIGDRSFSSDEKIVANLGVSTMQGIRDGGVIPVVKHFPGHGDTIVDSHVGLPAIGYDLERLKSFELIPFADAIGNHVDAVMIAHILMKKIDSEYPASLSKKIITGILREQMNFDGVIVTDDMTMGAIDKNYAIGSAVTKSVSAGSDIILVCHGYENQVDAISTLKDAVKNGSISEERIDESVLRIMLLKSKYGLQDNKIQPVNVDEINKKIDAVLNKWYNVSDNAGMQIHYTAPRELAARAKFSAKERGAEMRMGNYIMISAEIMI